MPVLLENTAGGGNAVLRDLGRLGPLWEAIGHLGVGVCLDTCHAWAAGEDLETAVDRVRAVTGGIALAALQRLPRPGGEQPGPSHQPGPGPHPARTCWPGWRRPPAAPIVVETPDDDGGQAADIAWLRERLAGRLTAAQRGATRKRWPQAAQAVTRVVATAAPQ